MKKILAAVLIVLGFSGCSGGSKGTDPARAAECKKTLQISDDGLDSKVSTCRREGYDPVWNAVQIYAITSDYQRWRTSGDLPTCEDIEGRYDPLTGGYYTKAVIASCKALVAGKDVNKLKGEFNTDISNAAARCGVEANVGDKGKSISFDTKGGEDVSGDELADIVCVLNRLKVPERVVQRIDSTRALDGSVEDKWSGYKAFWSYHPDNGLLITVYNA